MKRLANLNDYKFECYKKLSFTTKPPACLSLARIFHACNTSSKSGGESYANPCITRKHMSRLNIQNRERNYGYLGRRVSDKEKYYNFNSRSKTNVPCVCPLVHRPGPLL